MDYCEDFRLVQIALNHCHEYVKKFEKINDYGGNEIYVKEIALRLKNVFLSRNYNNEESQELRKINFLLMLNTDASYKYDLNEDVKICHLLKNFTQLTKCLYSNLVWHLKLEKYFYEAIKYSPSWFVLQFLDETIDSLRFSKSFDVIGQVKELVEAIYVNICRMDYCQSTTTEYKVDQKIILGKFTDSISSLLRNYNTPLTEESITKSKRKMKEYNGHSLNYQLQLLLTCFKLFQSKPKFEIDDKFHIFKICTEQEPERDNFSVSKYSVWVNNALIEINIILLNTLQNTILNITLEDFLYWVEIDMEDLLIEDVDLKRDNLQKLIGEQVYELIQVIESNSHVEHDIVKQLSTISIKPKTIEEIAKEATVGTILDRIESSPSKIVWLEELLNRPDTLYFNAECFQTIIENIDLVQISHMLRVLKDHQNYVMDDEDEVLLKELFVRGGSKLAAEDIAVFIEELIRTMGSDYNILVDSLQAFENEVRNYQNKISRDCIEEKIMWNLILKYPQRFYEMLTSQVDLNQDAELLLKVIEATTPISSNYVKDLILENTNFSVDSSKSTYHLLLAGIFKLEVMERKEFVKGILMNNFTKALSSNDYEMLLVHLQALKLVSNQLKINDLLPPLMINLAQILDKSRWDLMTFSTVREEVVELTVTIIQQLIKTISINGSKNDKEWIKSKVDAMKPLTRFYFQKLSLEKGEPAIALEKFLHPEGFASKPKIISFLCEFIVRCTMKEWKRLMANEVLQKFYTEALTVIASIVKKSNQPAPFAFIKKAVKDYVKILEETIIPAKINQQDDALLDEIINLMKQFPASDYDDLTILFLEALKSFKHCKNFSKLVELEDCDLKRILLE